MAQSKIIRSTSMCDALAQAAAKQGAKPATIGHYIAYRFLTSRVGMVSEPAIVRPTMRPAVTRGDIGNGNH